MFQCPQCASLSVSEERLIPAPSGEMKGWIRILLWPFRMPGMALVTTFAVLLTLGLMVLISNAIQNANPDTELDGGIFACGATLILGLYALVMSILPSVITSRLHPAITSHGSWLVRIPLRYHRTCLQCGYSWIWDPEKPTASEAFPRSIPPPDAHQNVLDSQSSPQDGRPPTSVQFRCPSCSYEGTFDPWTGPVHCPQCGYSPVVGKGSRRALKRARLEASQPYLQDFLRFWHGKPPGEPPFELSSEEEMIASFGAYRESLGEDLNPTPGQYYSSGYFRKHTPARDEILSFLHGYQMIRAGEKEGAHEKLSSLSSRSPDFIEAELWLAVTVEDPIDRNFHLETALQREPSHPLIVDIYSIIRGGVTYMKREDGSDFSSQLEAQHCPSCGGALQYQAGDSEVRCEYCGHRVIFQPMLEPDHLSHVVSSLRLQRKILGQSWQELDRILSCQACGSQLTMTEIFARVCAFCGSPNVIIEDQTTALEQPDGFIPFQIDERSAEKAIRRHQPSMLWDYKGWRAFKSLEYKHLKGIYLPFWVFDGLVEPVWAQMHRQGTFTKMSGPGSPYEAKALLFPGADRPAPSHLDQVSKYDLQALVEYQPHLLADWPALLYNLDVEVVVEDAYDVMIALAKEDMGPPIITGTTLPEGSRAVRTLQVARTTYQLILLPLWIAHLASSDAIALALVNGQTGDSTFSMVLRSGKA